MYILHKTFCMETRQKIIVGISAIILAFIGGFLLLRGEKKEVTVSQEKSAKSQLPQNTQEISQEGKSPLSGIACDTWNRRPLAVMIASDVPARPAAGLSQADMVFEMPVITSSVTRLMGVFVCNTPPEVGSMRSARVDFIHIAKGLDAIFAHWGRATWGAIDVLNRGEIENLNCNNDAGKSAGKCCFRKKGMKRGVDSGYARPTELLSCAKEFGYRLTNTFKGYPHQEELPQEKRIKKGELRVAYAGPFAVEYLYDGKTNRYIRYWGGKKDSDRNTGKEVAPKNVVVLFAESYQTEGQYNNLELGDPWYDKKDSGEAFYYINGKEYHGTWKKDKSSSSSKLFFYDSEGKEISFVPGQVWVHVLEPGQRLRWTVLEE